jgi:VWFA-related protein
MRSLQIGFALVVSLGLSGGAQQPVFRAGAQTVSVYATVRDRAGHLVPGLTKSDFQILDDGRPAVITTFSNDVLPATLALMLDMSTSMMGEQLRVRDAALQFVDALLPADRVRIGTFGDEVALSPWLTADKAILARVLREEVWPGGNTPLWTAMRAAMGSIAVEPGRKVVLTLTDGIDTGCPRMIGTLPAPEPLALAVRQTPPPAPPDLHCAGFGEVEQLSLDAEFLVYAIGMEGPGLTGGLVKLADESGGGHFELQKNEDLTATFSEVAGELHHQYALGFTPVTFDGRVHALDVRVRGVALTARARKNYVAVAR